MTKEQEERIKQDLRIMIPDLARKNQVFNDEVEQVIKECYGY